AIGDLAVGAALFQPLLDGADVVGRDAAAILEAQQVFQQYFQRKGEAGDARQPVPLSLRQGEVRIGLAGDIEGAAAFEAVERGLKHLRAPSSITRRAASSRQTTAGSGDLESAGEEERLS